MSGPVGQSFGDFEIIIRKLIGVFILILIGFTCGIAFAHSGATGIVKERMENFKASQRNLKKIKTLIKTENYAAIVPLANDIASWADKMPDYFPLESDKKPSEASPEIWRNFEGFTAAAQLNWEATLSLAKAAGMSDQKAVISAFKRVVESCKSCHKTYRLN